MNNRIKSCSLIIILLVSFISCKKDKADTAGPASGITADIDGKPATFNYGAKATTLVVSGGYGVVMSGCHHLQQQYRNHAWIANGNV